MGSGVMVGLWAALVIGCVPAGRSGSDPADDAGAGGGGGSADAGAEDAGVGGAGGEGGMGGGGAGGGGGACEPGERRVSPCGLNGRGTTSRLCADGMFGPPGACDDPDECVDGDENVVECADTTTFQPCIGGRWAEVECPDPPDNLCPSFQIEGGPFVVPAGGGHPLQTQVSDPDGDVVSVVWTGPPEVLIYEALDDPDHPLEGGPPDDPTTPDAVAVPLEEGRFEITAEITDDQGLTSPSATCPEEFDRVVITARANVITVQLTWDTDADPDQGDAVGTDMDLMLAHQNAGRWLDPMWTCYYSNITPDWPPLGEVAGDASLDIDDTDGAGPESMTLRPRIGDYAVGVHYFRATLGPAGLEDLPSIARVRLFWVGVPFAERSVRFDASDQFWDVGRIRIAGPDAEPVFEPGDDVLVHGVPAAPPAF